MNCKPGDLAIVVRVPGPATASILGKVIRVTRSMIDGGDVCWEYEGPPLLETEYSILGYIEDEFLRPIRPDGITDEEVRDLYASKQTEVVSV